MVDFFCVVMFPTPALGIFLRSMFVLEPRISMIMSMSLLLAAFFVQACMRPRIEGVAVQPAGGLKSIPAVTLPQPASATDAKRAAIRAVFMNPVLAFHIR